MNEKLTLEEDSRLKALRSYEIDYVKREITYDEISRLAALSLNVKVCLISFVEESTVYIKSSFGIEIKVAARENSFCTHTVNSKKVTIIKDIYDDERFSHSIKKLYDFVPTFYVGVPLVDINGFVIGCLSILDSEPREISESQMLMLQTLASHTIHLVELSHKRKKINEFFKKSLQLQKITKIGGWELDRNSHKISFSGEAYRILETDKSNELNMESFPTLFINEDRKKISRYLDRVFRFGDSFEDEFELDLSDKKKWIKVKGETFLENQDGINKVIGFVQDITNQKKLESLSSFYKRALDKAAIVAITDKRGIITYVNDMFCEISGFDRKELIGKSHRVVKSGLISKEIFQTMWETITRGDIWQGEICNKTKQGSLYWLDTTIVPYFNEMGRVEQFMAIRYDITELKEKQIKLEKVNKEAEIATIAKSNFLATVSHDIEKPISDLLVSSAQLQAEELNDRQLNLVKSIAKSGTNLLMTINDILDFSKIETNKLEIEKVSFNFYEFIELLIRPFRQQAEQRGLVFNAEIAQTPFNVLGDNLRIGQILKNLLNNAIKFTHKGSVSFKADFIELNDKVEFSITISDTGIGIEQVEQQKLFDAFNKVNFSYEQRDAGVGLGLTISRKFIKMMNGQMTFESEPDRGTIFQLKIPLKKVQVDRKRDDKIFKKKNIIHKYTAMNSRILIAEENQTNQLLLSKYLDKLGCQFHFVSNGNELLNALSTDFYDLILIDFQIAQANSYITIDEIRENNKIYSKIPIIGLMRKNNEENLKKCIENGINDYLEKPLILNSLYEKLRIYLIDNDKKKKEIELQNDQYKKVIFDKTALDNLKLAIGEEGVFELVKAYLDSIDKLAGDIFDALNNDDLELTSRSAHTLKSSTLSLGGIELGELCKEIEHLENLDQKSKYRDLLIQAVENIKQKLSSHAVAA